MKSSLIKTLALGCALLATSPWLASAAQGGKGGAKHGPDPIQAALDKLTLTDEQKTKIKAIQDKANADRQEFMKAHAEELKAAKAANDKEKMHSIGAPLMEKRKATVAEIKAVLTDEQKKQFDESMPAGHGKKNK